jgi:RNA polymerase-binding transcription factor DksA
MRSTGAISSAQLRDLEADIRQELARIERSLARESDYDSSFSTEGTTLRAPQFGGEGELTVTLASRNQARQMELTEALRRIEDGRYGVCGNCGGSIPYGRLMVVPEATSCLTCR